MPLIANNAPLKPTTAYTIELTNLVQGLVSDEKKVEIAKSMGLVDALCIGKDDIDAIVKEKTNGTGIDRAFEASGAGAAFKQAISLLRMEGTLGLVGRTVHSLEIENQTFEKILRFQITIKGTWSFEFKEFPQHRRRA